MSLADRLAYAADATIAEEWLRRMPVIEQIHIGFSSFAEENPDVLVYGYNTLAGHRDHLMLDAVAAQRFQSDLIDNHLLGHAPWYDGSTARAITRAKIQQIANGGCIVSPDLFQSLIELSMDSDFSPSIPRQATYSCGDVIPGAHWARSALKHLETTGAAHTLRPGEGMALINGSFVHVGVALALLPRLRDIVSLSIMSLRSDMHLCAIDSRMIEYWIELGIDASDVREALSGILDGLPRSGPSAQWPVSFRAARECLSTLMEAVKGFELALDDALAQPSSNPLLLQYDGGEGRQYRPHPQASFLQPRLVLAAMTVLEAIKLFAWGHQSRMKWTLSGNVPGIPLDGQADTTDIAFIQWPKISQSMLETLRMRSAGSPFSHGSDTSYGVEDIWTNGVAHLDVLAESTTAVERMLSIGLSLKARLANRFLRQHGLDEELAHDLRYSKDFEAAHAILIRRLRGANAKKAFTTA